MEVDSLDMSAYDKMCEVTFWIGIPIVRLTESSKKKSIRVMGLVISLVLFPLAIVAVPFLFLTVIVGIIEDA